MGPPLKITKNMEIYCRFFSHYMCLVCTMIIYALTAFPCHFFIHISWPSPLVTQDLHVVFRMSKRNRNKKQVSQIFTICFPKQAFKIQKGKPKWGKVQNSCHNDKTGEQIKGRGGCPPHAPWEQRGGWRSPERRGPARDLSWGPVCDQAGSYDSLHSLPWARMSIHFLKKQSKTNKTVLFIGQEATLRCSVTLCIL